MPVMAHKKMLELQGFHMGPARFPFRDLSGEESRTIEEGLESFWATWDDGLRLPLVRARGRSHAGTYPPDPAGDGACHLALSHPGRSAVAGGGHRGPGRPVRGGRPALLGGGGTAGS